MLEDIENIIYGGSVIGYDEVKAGNGYNSLSEIVETIRKAPKKYIDSEKYIAYLYEKDLRIGIVGHVESNLKTDSNYQAFLKSNNYYGLEKLKEYSTIIYEPQIDSNESESTYKISDPDGFTNLRKEKSTTSSILEKVKTGESVEVIEQSGDWYLVKTKAGNEGYVFKTKIVSE
jgi:hypothetical protein